MNQLWWIFITGSQLVAFVACSSAEQLNRRLQDGEECRSTLPSLSVRFTSTEAYDLSADLGGEFNSDPGQNVVFFRPDTRPNEFRLTYAAVVQGETSIRELKPAVESIVVTADRCSTGALAVPDEFLCTYATTRNSNVDIFRPSCPDGFVSLSDVAVINNGGRNRCVAGGEGSRRPEDVDPDFRCVAESLTVELERATRPFSTARGGQPGDNPDAVQFFRPVGRTDSFRAGSTTISVDRVQYKLSSVPRPLFRDLNIVQQLLNPSAVEQSMSFEITKGFESSTTITNERSTEITNQLSLKVSGGVKGVVDTEVETTFSLAWSTSSSVSTSEVTTTEQKSQVTVTVPSFSRATLSQLIIGDSQFGKGQSTLNIFTSYFALQITALEGGGGGGGEGDGGDGPAGAVGASAVTLLNSVAVLQDTTASLVSSLESILIDRAESEDIQMSIAGLGNALDIKSEDIEMSIAVLGNALNNSTENILRALLEKKGSKKRKGSF